MAENDKDKKDTTQKKKEWGSQKAQKVSPEAMRRHCARVAEVIDPVGRGKHFKEEPKKVPFTCRVCGGHHYEAKCQSTSNGVYGPGSTTSTTIIGYTCCSCSVVFDDPEKFNRPD